MIGKASITRLLLGAALLAAGGCSTTAVSSDSATPAASTTSLARADTSAATLRQRLDGLLEEHVSLAAAATDAALAGRNDEYTAAATALDSNSQELAAAIGSMYGADAQQTFLKLWRDQIGYLIDYTQGMATDDDDKKEKARTDMNTAAGDTADFLQTLTEGRLKREAVKEILKSDDAVMISIIADQKAGDYESAYNKQRDAGHAVLNFGDPLADVIVDQFPDKFASNP